MTHRSKQTRQRHRFPRRRRRTAHNSAPHHHARPYQPHVNAAAALAKVFIPQQLVEMR